MTYCLHEEFYNGWKIVIMNFGIHPCGYIGTSDKENFFFEKSYNELADMEFYGSVNGGFTYASFGVSGFYEQCWFLGWDYSHCGDYAGYNNEDNQYKNAKKWTTKEIIKEAKEQIDEINNVKFEEKIIKEIKIVKTGDEK